MILCCLSWYISLDYWIFPSCCLLLWSHCSWNTFILLAKESIKSFLFVDKYFVLFVVIYFSQLLQFFFLLFTSLISLFLKLLQFDGKGINQDFLFRSLIIWSIHGFRCFHWFLFWIVLIQHSLDYVRIGWKHFWEIFFIFGLYIALRLIEDQRLVGCWDG